MVSGCTFGQGFNKGPDFIPHSAVTVELGLFRGALFSQFLGQAGGIFESCMHFSGFSQIDWAVLIGMPAYGHNQIEGQGFELINML